jgi:hypothetical protein
MKTLTEQSKPCDADIWLDGQKPHNILWGKVLKLTGHKDDHVKYNILNILLFSVKYSLISSLCKRLQDESFHSSFITKTLCTFLFLCSRVLHAPPTSHFDYVRNIWWRAQFIRCLKIHFPLSSYYFRLLSKHLCSTGFCFLYTLSLCSQCTCILPRRWHKTWIGTRIPLLFRRVTMNCMELVREERASNGAWRCNTLYVV